MPLFLYNFWVVDCCALKKKKRRQWIKEHQREIRKNYGVIINVLYLSEPLLQVFSNNDDPRCVTVILHVKQTTSDKETLHGIMGTETVGSSFTPSCPCCPGHKTQCGSGNHWTADLTSGPPEHCQDEIQLLKGKWQDFFFSAILWLQNTCAIKYSIYWTKCI